MSPKINSKIKNEHGKNEHGRTPAYHENTIRKRGAETSKVMLLHKHAAYDLQFQKGIRTCANNHKNNAKINLETIGISITNQF